MSRARQSTFQTDDIDPLQTVEAAKPTGKPATADDEKIHEISKVTGFNSRLAAENAPEPEIQPGFDARSLRKSSRTAQLNIAIQPATKDRFWQFAVEEGAKVGEEALLKLLEKAGA